ncbi:NAD-P-binding protein [Trametopsis cervina]|nr:NAD-P-binding protein [Trametopsis cervina]
MVDILVIGATGYTGQLVVRYLNEHPERSKFTLGIAARSKGKLTELKAKLSLSDKVRLFYVDVTKWDEMEEVVRSASVVINAVGPYWRWGAPVVRACARHGKHYVDLSGEQHWIREMILKYDYAASKTHAIIIPSCGFDSVPSDLAVFLGNKTLKTLVGPDSEIDSSISAFDVKGSVSGGTFSTIINTFEEVPPYKLQLGMQDWALSTHLRGEPGFSTKLIYKLPFLPIVGGIWVMAGANTAIVQRSWGLNQRVANNSNSREAKIRSYGPKFKYDEFKVASSTIKSFFLSLSMVFGLAVLIIPPLRWLAKKLGPAPGTGPSEEELKNYSMEVTNITSSVATPSKPATHVRTVVKGNRDPGYVLASVMVAESALALLLSKSELPELAQQGGILTPASALGDVLVKRLEASQLMSFESEVILGSQTENRKNT